MLTGKDIMKILVFDLETRKDAKTLRPDNEELGWTALREGEGGISALAIWDVTEQWLYLYDDYSIQAAVAHLESADVLVSFYGEKFDVPVIEGILGRKLRIKYHYDIYREIAEANAHRGIVGRKGDFTLDAVCKRNIGKGKTSNGAHAVELVKLGKFGELFNYCGHDVKLTKELFEYACLGNGVMNINNSFLPLSIPDWIKKAMI
jgi:DEAD/DEAH box helicase domain-containing protein